MTAAEPAGMPPGQLTSAQVDAWQSLSGQVGVRLRPVASPTSLGIFGLAAATLTLAGLQLGWVAPSEGKHVAIVLVAFAAMAQLVASIIAFGARDGTVATVMGVLSLTWLSVGLVMFTSGARAARRCTAASWSHRTRRAQTTVTT